MAHESYSWTPDYSRVTVGQPGYSWTPDIESLDPDDKLPYNSPEYRKYWYEGDTGDNTFRAPNGPRVRDILEKVGKRTLLSLQFVEPHNFKDAEEVKLLNAYLRKNKALLEAWAGALLLFKGSDFINKKRGLSINSLKCLTMTEDQVTIRKGGGGRESSKNP